MVKFINSDLETYLQGYLKKINITEEDLDNVKSLNINSFDLSGNYISNSLEDLNLFKNLKKLKISNYVLNRENINIIDSLKGIEDYIFYKCDIKDMLEISRKKYYNI